MREIDAWLMAGARLLHGKYREEVVLKEGRSWVWFKTDSGQWTLQCPSRIVLDEKAV